jgi:carbon-monoxide dehydrogenase medium subunit
MHSLRSFLRPKSLSEALAMRAETAGRGAYIAGGTDLLAASDPGLEFLVDLSRLPLAGVECDRGSWRLGAMTPLADIVRHSALDGLAGGILQRGAAAWGTSLIRERATIGGLLAGAHPAADLPAALIALGAEIVYCTAAGDQRVAVESFFLGEGQTVLGLGILTEIVIPAAACERRGAHERLSRTRVDITLVGAAATRRDTGPADWRLALCGVSDRPVLHATPELDGSSRVDGDALARLSDRVRSSLSPPDDHRASADYRRTIAGVLARRVVSRLAESTP